MKHTLVWLMALTLSATLATTKLSAQGTQMTKDQQDLLAAIQTMTAAFVGKDIDTVMASYESPATVVFEPGKPVSDRATLTEMFTGMAGVMSDGTKVSQSGLSVAVLRRQPDGTWLMVIDHPHAQTLLDAAN